MIPWSRPIVAGVASLQWPAEPVLVAAMRLAAGLGAPLHLVHVLPHHPPYGTPDGPAAAELLRMAARRLEFDARDVAVRVLRGPAEQRLLQAAEEADAALLVLGATRRSRLARALLGTTAGHVLRAARTPVLVVRAPLPVRRLKVLLTTDLTRHAAHAHSRGGGIAAALSAPEPPELRSLYVDPTPLPDAPLAPTALLGGAERDLEAFLAGEVPRAGSVPRVRAGDPAEEIVREAREWGADLLVLGTHAREGVPRVLLGSVAEAVLRNAPCAALVIPPMRPYRMADPSPGAARPDADPGGRGAAAAGLTPRAGPATP